MNILVQEEYGYDYYLWCYPGSLEELIADWRANKTPITTMIGTPALQQYQGTFEQLETFMRPEETDAFIHFHEEEDTYMKIGRKTYKFKRVRTQHVCLTADDLKRLQAGEYGQFTFRWVSAFSEICQPCSQAILGLWTGSR